MKYMNLCRGMTCTTQLYIHLVDTRSERAARYCLNSDLQGMSHVVHRVLEMFEWKSLVPMVDIRWAILNGFDMDGQKNSEQFR